MKQTDIMRRFWPHVVEFRRHMIVGILLMVLMVTVDLAQPNPLKILSDYVIGSQPVPGILQPVYSAIGDRPFDLLVFVGRIVESGTHDELLEKGGRYGQLYRIQTPALSIASDPPIFDGREGKDGEEGAR